MQLHVLKPEIWEALEMVVGLRELDWVHEEEAEWHRRRWRVHQLIRQKTKRFLERPEDLQEELKDDGEEWSRGDKESNLEADEEE